MIQYDIENGKHDNELGMAYFWKKCLEFTAF